MSNLSDLLNDIGNSNATPAQALGDTLGTVADLAGTVGAVVSIVGLLIGKQQNTETQLQEIEDTITNVYNELAAGQNATNIINTIRDNTDSLSFAEPVLQSLKGYLNLQPPLTDLQVLNVISPCITAVDELVPSIWNQVYSYQFYWTDAGVYTYQKGAETFDCGYGEEPPVGESSDVVFSYIYYLPAYLDAIYIFLTCALALRSRSYVVATWGASLIQPTASSLAGAHDLILNNGANAFVEEPISGIVQLSPYTLNGNLREPFYWDGQILANLLSDFEKQGGFGPPGITPMIGFPSGVNIEYGAVDTFSGYSSMADYNILFSDLPPNSTDPAPFRKFMLRLLRRAKNVYAAVGLGSVWTTINILSGLTGNPLMPRPNFGDWSFRAICSYVAAPDGSVKLSDFAKFLKNTPPFDTPPSLVTSFQNLLSPPSYNPVGGPPF